MSTSFRYDYNTNGLVVSDAFQTVSDTNSLIQDVKSMLQMWKGEYPFNINEGIDYVEFFQNQDKVMLLAEIRNRIRTDSRVRMVDLSVNGDKKLVINITTTENKEIKIELD